MLNHRFLFFHPPRAHPSPSAPAFPAHPGSPVGQPGQQCRAVGRWLGQRGRGKASRPVGRSPSFIHSNAVPLHQNPSLSPPLPRRLILPLRRPPRFAASSEPPLDSPHAQHYLALLVRIRSSLAIFLLCRSPSAPASALRRRPSPCHPSTCRSARRCRG
jgi:hypothetical protein